MLKYIIIGSGFAFAAAAQPGPLQAFYLSKVAASGWRRTLPACIAPLISDIPIALLVLLVLHHISGGFESILKAAGGAVLLYFAYRAFLEWRRGEWDSTEEAQSAPRTLLQAVVVNLLNPGPYLGWSLILGPLTLEAWQQSPIYSIALIGAFYTSMVLCLALFILLLGTTAFLGPRGRRALILASALALAALGIYQLIFILV
ncbi:MAG: LysE family transporter [Proteobacteria bacterium]|nr:LysE family transporter [Pseudomonadota bacterium]